MTLPAPTAARWLHGVRQRAATRVLLAALPWLAVAGLVAGRLPAGLRAWMPLAIAALATGAWLLRTWRRHDARWLAARLNAEPAFEDSAELLLDLQSPQHGLAHLQQQRLQARWHGLALEPHLPPWHTRGLLANLLLAGAAALLLLAWQRPMPVALQARLPPAMVRMLVASAPSLRRLRLHVQPPAYTGLAPRTIAPRDARVPEGAQVTWQVEISGRPRQAWLQVEGGSRVPLQRQTDTWQAQLRVERPLLYRIVTEPALPATQRGLHVLGVSRDQPPRIRMRLPTRSLNLRSPGQRHWPLRFDATDDYGVEARAELRIIQTSGDGENITSSERVVGLSGSGPARARAFAYTFDLTRSGLTAGNDVIVQLTVRDSRRPTPHVVRSASAILRWPPEQAALSGGLDGLAQRALPAYFRSQRQIIIDAEALLRERRRLTPEVFLKRSDAIGVDQHALRLRYGQFLGEEAEEPASLPTNDVDDASAPETDASADSGAHDHDAVDAGPPAAWADAMLADVSHVHDLPEAATLLDPATRDLLRAALREMWDAERRLRQGDPADALPFAYKALGLIKQVQRADRIYLPRLGSELPPIDFTRRLSGKREDIAGRSNGFSARAPADAPLAALWRALAPERDARAVPGPVAAAAVRWLQDRGSGNGDPLRAIAALDRLRQDPACGDCRQAVREATWPQLVPALPTPRPRDNADATGERYLDALQREAAK